MVQFELDASIALCGQSEAWSRPPSSRTNSFPAYIQRDTGCSWAYLAFAGDLRKLVDLHDRGCTTSPRTTLRHAPIKDDNLFFFKLNPVLTHWMSELWNLGQQMSSNWQHPERMSLLSRQITVPDSCSVWKRHTTGCPLPTFTEGLKLEL